MRIYIIFLCFLMAFFGRADATNATRPIQFYIGPSVGVSQLSGHQTLTYTNNGAGPSIYGMKSSGNHTTGTWGLIGGITIPIKEKNFLDVDLYYVNQNNKMYFVIDRNGYTYANLYLRKKYSYGAALSVGTQFYEGSMPLSGYIRLGLEYGKIETRQYYDAADFIGQGFIQHKTLIAFAPGIGLKLDVNDNIFLKFGYTYVFPREINLVQYYKNNGGGYYQYKFTQQEQRVELSLGWKI